VGATVVDNVPPAGTVKVKAPVTPVERESAAYDVQLCVRPRPVTAEVDMEVEHAVDM